MNGMMLRRSVALLAGVPAEQEVGHHTDLHFGIRYAQTATRPFLLIAEEVSAYRLSSQSVARAGGIYELDGDLDYAALERITPRDAWERRARRHALDVAAPWAVLALVARGERQRAAVIWWRHRRQMPVPWTTQIKLALVVGSALVGVVWPAALLRRRRFGLSMPRGLFLRRAS
jgi:hypothetical protein